MSQRIEDGNKSDVAENPIVSSAVMSENIMHIVSFSEHSACYLVDVGFAVKVLEKRHIVRENKTQYVKREKEVLMRIDHPFFVKLHFTFQDDDRLCIFYPLKSTIT